MIYLNFFEFYISLDVCGVSVRVGHRGRHLFVSGLSVVAPCVSVCLVGRGMHGCGMGGADWEPCCLDARKGAKVSAPAEYSNG